MKMDFTSNEIENYLRMMRADNDVARLVDPLTQQVYVGADTLPQEESCCHVWERYERCEICTSLRALQTQSRAYKLELLRGRTYLVLSRYLRVDGRAYVAEVVNDITEQFIMDSSRRDEIGKIINTYNHQLITDSLTGVYNRRFLDDNFIPSLQRYDGNDLRVNLAFADMDNFKHVNDLYGHTAGDILLKDVAGFWQLHFHSREKGNERLVVRYGGDEFLIIACGGDFEQFCEEIKGYYNQMRKICYYTDTIQIPFGISFGLSSSQELGEGWDWGTLIALADRRMYEKKAPSHSSKSPSETA